MIKLVAEGKPGCTHIDLQKKAPEDSSEKQEPFENVFNRSFILAMAEAAMRGTLQKTVQEISRLQDYLERKQSNTNLAHNIFLGVSSDKKEAKNSI